MTSARIRPSRPPGRVMAPKAKIPPRMLDLPRDLRDVPIPWFAGRDADGRLRVTIVDRAKWRDAVENRRCGMCGAPLQRSCTFVLGPIQVLTRTTTEPPSHLGCAEYAVRVCPFLSNPARDRFDGVASQTGAPVNPGVFALWQTLSFEESETRGKLIVGEPFRVAWRTRGRPATAAEIRASQAMAAKLIAAQNSGE
jgi:hypothetical protein